MSGSKLALGDKDWVKLREEFRARVEANRRGWPARKSFASFFRKTYHFRFERYWKALQVGQPVPFLLAKAFVEYVRESWHWDDVTIDNAIEPAVVPILMEDEGIWSDARTMLAALTDRFGDCDEMYCRNRFLDIPAAARMIVACVGRKVAKPGQALDDKSCLRRGEEEMQRSVDDYTRWLLKMHHEEDRSVMFAVCNSKSKGWQRASVAVTLPLSEGAFRRFCAGEVADHQLEPDDLQSPSRYVFVNALGEPADLPEISVYQKTLAQAHVLLYQAAYFTRGIRPFRPVGVTIATNRQYESRVQRQDYRNTGTCMHGTDKPIMVLATPSDGGVRSVMGFASYRAFWVSMRMYQMANRRQWKKEDRLRR